MLLRSILAACALAVLAVAPARASLIGAEIDITSPHGDCLNVTVGAGLECTITDGGGGGDDIDIDVGASSIVFEFRDIGTGGFDFLWSADPLVFDIVIDGLDDAGAAIASIAVSTELFGVAGPGGSPNTIGASQSGPNQITMVFGDLDRLNCDTVNSDSSDTTVCGRLTIDLTFADASDAPEPMTLGLVGLGLAGLGIARRRRA